MANIHTAHWKLTAAGWPYRSNHQGWTIYRDPQTGRWHTACEAIAILEGNTLPRAAV